MASYRNGRCDATRLMDQAPATVQVYMMHAQRDIDGEFGEGYAKAHPELVGAYIQACALDYGAGLLANELDAVTAALESLSGLSEIARVVDEATFG